MAGHSKWANIKFRKAAQDAKRGKLFTKLIREITVSARTGGGDADANPRLRTAIDKALAANMTRDTIDRAIQRGAGDLDGVNYEDVRYEGYGPGGIAILVDCATDNRNRTVSEVRHAFNKYGGNLGTDGSVAYLFTKTGLFVFAPDCDEDKIMEEAIAAGAEDVEVNDDGSVEVLSTPEQFESVKGAFKDAGLMADVAEIVQRPATETELAGEDADTIEKLIDMLEDLDDVQEVYTNAVFSDR
ncbi:MAG: putative transcriptional regulatory protein [marine bacterium B5-7]|nr:MAG: putative transcriptional regulatory protein [marine bacterium B5-7]